MKHFITLLFINLLVLGAFGQDQTTTQEVESDEIATVLGGIEATAEEFPWMVTLITDQGNQGCGASLIREDWVLTAGHCHAEGFLAELMGSNVQVLINSLTTDPNNMESYSELIDIEATIGHDDWDFFAGGSDIALIKLASPSTITPIPLGLESEADLYAHGEPGVVLGWGNTGGGQTSIPLLKSNCTFFGHDECSTMYEASQQASVEPHNICAGYFEGDDPAGAAQGDSGGPLVYLDGNGEYRQIGVVSGGNSEITTVDFPGLFTQVTAFEEWINETIDNYEGSTSVSELNKNKVSVFMDDQNNMNINGLNRFSSYDITITDLMGRTVYSDTDLSNNSSFSVELDHNITGALIINILNTSSGQLINKKCVRL